MDELKPCPFCGGKASLEEYLGRGFYVTCNSPCCSIRPCSFSEDTEEEAVEAWNRRADDVK